MPSIWAGTQRFEYWHRPGSRRAAPRMRRGQVGLGVERPADADQVGLAAVEDLVDLGAASRMPPTASTGIDTAAFAAANRLRFHTGRNGRRAPPST